MDDFGDEFGPAADPGLRVDGGGLQPGCVFLDPARLGNFGEAISLDDEPGRDPSQVLSRRLQISRWHAEIRIRAARRLGALLGSVSILTLEMVARSGQRWPRFANPKLFAALTCVAFLLNACGGGSKELAVLHGQDARPQSGASVLAEAGDGDGDGDYDDDRRNSLTRSAGAFAIAIEPGASTLGSNGSVSNEGSASYRNTNSGARYPGTFSGARTAYSFDDSGYWATQGFETLFKA